MQGSNINLKIREFEIIKVNYMLKPNNFNYGSKLFGMATTGRGAAASVSLQKMESAAC
jgi:hypothetical protein